MYSCFKKYLFKDFPYHNFLRSCSGMGWDDLVGEGCEVIVLSNKSAQ